MNTKDLLIVTGLLMLTLFLFMAAYHEFMSTSQTNAYRECIYECGKYNLLKTNCSC